MDEAGRVVWSEVKDGSVFVYVDPRYRVTWVTREGMMYGVKVAHYFPRPATDPDVRSFTFGRPFVWLGTQRNDGGVLRSVPYDQRDPRQWRVYSDGEIVEGPSGNYDNGHIAFPEWPVEDQTS